MEIMQKFLLHYYLKDKSHSMNALIRNKCEAELLAIAHEISLALEIQCFIEAEASQEGGFKDIWRFIGRNVQELTLILTIVGIVLSRIPLDDPEMAALNKEEKKLSIEEKKLQIEKLRRELKLNQVSSESVENISSSFSKDLKITTRKSNFYKHLVAYEKVIGIGIAQLNSNNQPIGEERYIPHEDFSGFLLTSNNLPTEVIEAAEIEIVSPVLREGNYKWKGIYQGTAISFSMADKEFRNSVLQRVVSFQHGSSITCILNRPHFRRDFRAI